MIKYDYATSTQLGEEGSYRAAYATYSEYKSNYKGIQDNLTNIGGYYWTSKGNYDNEWVDSELRKTNLNEYYLNIYLKETKHIDVDKLITNHTWSLNGHDDNEVIPKVMYDNEMNKVESSLSVSTKTKSIENKIGLMYVSDYGYAASPSITKKWTTTLYDYDINNISVDNWMHMGLFEWTISRNSSNNAVFYVDDSGAVYNDGLVYHDGNVIRPSFYLTSDAKISEGEGSKEKPYRISFE